MTRCKCGNHQLHPVEDAFLVIRRDGIWRHYRWGCRFQRAEAVSSPAERALLDLRDAPPPSPPETPRSPAPRDAADDYADPAPHSDSCVGRIHDSLGCSCRPDPAALAPSPPETPAPEDQGPMKACCLAEREACARRVEACLARMRACEGEWVRIAPGVTKALEDAAVAVRAGELRSVVMAPASPASAPRETRAKHYDADAWDGAMAALGKVTEQRDAARAELEGAKAVLADAAEYARNKCPQDLWVRICGVLTWACVFSPSAPAPPEAPASAPSPSEKP